MLNRRQMLRNMITGAGGAAAAATFPLIARPAGECDQFGNCVVGVPTNVFNMVDAKQRLSQWCWAASAQMILNYHDIPVTQEEIVYRIKGAFVDAAANYLEIVRSLSGRAVDRRGREVYIEARTMGITTENILSDLYEDRPLLLAYETGEGGHAVVLTAISFRMIETYAGTDYRLETATVRDPWPDRPSRQTWNADQLAARVSFMARVMVYS